MNSTTEDVSTMPYKEMYQILQQGQGRQIAMCKKYLQESAELYCEILRRERADAAQEYSLEREYVNRLMAALSELYSCMMETDMDVENVVLQ